MLSLCIQLILGLVKDQLIRCGCCTHYTLQHVKILSCHCLLESILLPLPCQSLQILIQLPFSGQWSVLLFPTYVSFHIYCFSLTIHLHHVQYSYSGCPPSLGVFVSQNRVWGWVRIPVSVYYSLTYLTCRDNVSESRSPDLLIFTDAICGLSTTHLVLQAY